MLELRLRYTTDFWFVSNPQERANMSPSDMEALRSDIEAGFRTVSVRFDAIDTSLEALKGEMQALRGEMEVGFHDAQQGIHGLMLKLLAVTEVNEIRSNMTSPPDLKSFPVWALR